MPIKRIYKGPNAAQDAGGIYSGFGVLSTDGRIYLNRDGTKEPIATDYTKIITADTILTAEDDGVTLIFNSTDPITVTLPAVATCGAGVKFTFCLKLVADDNGQSIVPNAVDYITGNGLTADDGEPIYCPYDTPQRVGDTISIVSDGVDGWFITRAIGTWAKGWMSVPDTGAVVLAGKAPSVVEA